jgi:hypothetical protein
MIKLDHFRGERIVHDAELNEDWAIDGQSNVKLTPAGDVNPAHLMRSLTINGQSRAVVSLPIDRLGLVDGQSSLQATSVIEMVDKLDGQSTLRLDACNAFRGKVDGQSNLFVVDGGGVTFNDKIDGQSTVEFKAATAIKGTVLSGKSRLYCPQACTVDIKEEWGGEVVRNS